MPGDVTQLLQQIAAGDAAGAERLVPALYEELRRMAAARLAAEKPGQTIQPTALVHEAYLRLVGDQHFASRAHFFAAAAEAMRRILVENARRKRSARRGGDAAREELREEHLLSEPREDDLLEIHEVLDRLEQHDPQAAALVKLRFFAGLEHREAAELLGLSRRAADRLWLLARTWLYRTLAKADGR
ncbi:MAG: ECF-type sigma factor [Isosphaeraceae bacterium]